MDLARIFGSEVYVLFVSRVEAFMPPEEKELLENLKVLVERARKTSGLGSTSSARRATPCGRP